MHILSGFLFSLLFTSISAIFSMEQNDTLLSEYIKMIARQTQQIVISDVSDENNTSLPIIYPSYITYPDTDKNDETIQQLPRMRRLRNNKRQCLNPANPH